MKDYVAYIDTDSLFIKVQDFLFDNGVTKEQWATLSVDEKTAYVLEIAGVIEEHVNDESYEKTQRGEYNSQVPRDVFAIAFKQEIVCKSALFISKKKYGFHLVNREGLAVDKIDVTGLEIIRSETPSVFKEGLKEMLGMILKGAKDSDIVDRYNHYKRIAKKSAVEEISENKGVSNILKWADENGEPISKTPYHVKATLHYHKMLKVLGLENKYPHIQEDSKNRLVYVKPNRFGINCIMYDRFPEEFLKVGLEPDYEKMIDKFLTEKLKMLLTPAKKEHILNQNESFSAFFGE